MSWYDYEEILIQHLEECEDCEKGNYPKIEDCPAFKKYMAKLEAQADYEYERMKEKGLDGN